MRTQPAKAVKRSKGPGAPCQVNAEAPNVGTSTLSVDQSSRSVNRAASVGIGQRGVQIVPITKSAALQRARCHDVLLDGERVGGVCWARGAWRILSNAQARFDSREAAVNELLRRRGCSQ